MEKQTYANHRHRAAFWLTGALASSVALVLMLWAVIQTPTLTNLALLLLAYGAFVATYSVRQAALKLQDRIIRLEMRIRLVRLGREPDLARLSLRQIVALRFASDAELPALVNRAIVEKMTGDQIKQAITAWQADHLRT